MGNHVQTAKKLAYELWCGIPDMSDSEEEDARAWVTPVCEELGIPVAERDRLCLTNEDCEDLHEAFTEFCSGTVVPRLASTRGWIPRRQLTRGLWLPCHQCCTKTNQAEIP